MCDKYGLTFARDSTRVVSVFVSAQKKTRIYDPGFKLAPNGRPGHRSKSQIFMDAFDRPCRGIYTVTA